MRIQLWSYNYSPEPTGIGPVSATLAERLRERGHELVVVAAHPHYPSPLWGRRLRPYRERRNEVSVIRLPLWIGRMTTAERYRQELSFMIAQTLSTPFLPPADIVVSASPCFPALLPAIGVRKLRAMPWVIWLHDLLPDGATTTGLMEEGAALSAARRLERSAYANSDRIVVLSTAFIQNLVAKGVPEDKIRLVYDPATRIPRTALDQARKEQMRVLSMGNIGYSQGVAPLVDAFQRDSRMERLGARLMITGNGVAEAEVRALVSSDRIEMPGVVDDDRLEHELQRAHIALVSQRYEGSEFNIPSKLMNFMMYGLPVVAAVDPGGEVARVIETAGCGWVVDSRDPEAFPAKLAELAAKPLEVDRCALAARTYARKHFSQEAFASNFEAAISDLAPSHGARSVTIRRERPRMSRATSRGELTERR